MTSGETHSDSRGRGRPPLISRKGIIEAAAELGLDNLSMSGVAAKLGVATQSLYRHVASRQELVNLTVNHLVTTWEFPEDEEQPLAEWLYAYGQNTRRVLLEHPGLAGELQSIGPGKPEILYLTERTIDILVQRGCSPLTSFLLIGSVANATIAAVVRQERIRSIPDDQLADDLISKSAIAELDPKEIPHISSLASYLIDSDGDRYFKFFIQSLIDGMIRKLLPED